MNLDSNILRMLEEHPEKMTQIDKIREILQQAALLGLARHQFFEHAVFYGGTALRILYGLDRYSEDLDFSLLTQKPDFDFAPFLQGMHQELEAMGFDLEVDIKKKIQDTGIVSAFLKANTKTLVLSIQKKCNRIHPDQKIQIKLEIDTDPPPVQLSLENKLVKSPVPFYVVTYRLADLFAGKMHAALCRSWKTRVKGRDWYDVVWYIQRKVPVAMNYLREKMIQTGHLARDDQWNEEVLRKKMEDRIEKIDWELAKSDVAPFIADQRKLELWSAGFFHDLVQDLHVTS